MIVYFLRNIRNSEEEIAFSSGLDILYKMEYNDNAPWQSLADGNGFSLAPNETNPNGDQNAQNKWTNSCTIKGFPRTDEPIFTNKNFDLWVNEVLTHTDILGVNRNIFITYGEDIYYNDDINRYFQFTFLRNRDYSISTYSNYYRCYSGK